MVCCDCDVCICWLVCIDDVDVVDFVGVCGFVCE